jgi:hypothetical protein
MEKVINEHQTTDGFDLGLLRNSKRRASKICVSIVEGIQIPHQLDHSGAYHQEVKDRMGAP